MNVEIAKLKLCNGHAPVKYWPPTPTLAYLELAKKNAQSTGTISYPTKMFSGENNILSKPTHHL